MTRAIPLPDEVPCVLRSVDGRLKWINVETVARLRAEKLARIRWRDQPVRFVDGLVPDFLPAEIAAAFDIPEDVPVSDNVYGAPVIKFIKDNPDRLFLDVGAGLRHIYYKNVVNVDIYKSVSTDVICVGEQLPFADDQFDAVLCFAVLEHTLRPWEVAREICRVLKPGGTVMADWPFLQPMHGYPHHYFNATPSGNRSIFEAYCDITSVEIGWHHHPAIAVQWILTAWRDGLPAGLARKFEAMTVGSLIGDNIEQQLAQDHCTQLRLATKEVIASGSLVTGIKRPAPIAASSLAASEQYHAVARQNIQLRNELDRLHASLSWRITAPLRAMRHKLRGAVGVARRPMRALASLLKCTTGVHR